jgi:tetratricopeptide (TPR) repeat protein
MTEVQFAGSSEEKPGEATRQMLLKTIELYPQMASAHANLGRWYAQRGFWEQAVACYQEAFCLQPDNAIVHRSLVRAWKQLGEREKAIASFQQAVAVGRKAPSCLSKLGYFLCSQIPPAETLEYLQQAWELYGEEQFDEILKCCQQSLSLYLDSGWFQIKLREQIADALIDKQEWDAALQYLVQVLQRKPDEEKAYEQIRYILQQQGKEIFSSKATSPSPFCELPDDFLKEFCDLPDTYQVDPRTSLSVEYIPIYPAQQVSMSPSKRIDDGAGEDVRKNLQGTQIVSPEAFVAVVPRGYAWGDNLTTAAFTPSYQLIADTSTGFGELVLSSSSHQLPAVRYIRGTVAFLSVRWGDRGYFHWMFDVLARLHLLERSGIHNIDKFVFNQIHLDFQKETLLRLGIPQEKIIESCQMHHIQADRLVVPSIPKLRGYRSAKWACNFLRERFLDKDAKDLSQYSERLYINRVLVGHRNVVNEDEVIQTLEEFGFQSISLESMSLSEQAACMRKARVIVAPHGAGLTNLVFCQPGTKVIEIFSPAHVQSTYWIISNVCDLEHYHLMSDEEALGETSEVRGTRRDIFVNIQQLLKLMDMAGVK